MAQSITKSGYSEAGSYNQYYMEAYVKDSQMHVYVKTSSGDGYIACAGIWINKTRNEARYSATGRVANWNYAERSSGTFPAPKGSTSGDYSISRGGTVAAFFGAGVGKYVGPWDSSHRNFTDGIYLEFPWITVSFNLNGGDSGGGSLGGYEGDDLTMPSASKTNYTFDGWYTSASGGTRVGGSGTVFDCPSGGTTYYAHWTLNTGAFDLNILNPDGSQPYTTGEAGSVEFSSNGGSSYSRVYNEPASSYLIGTSFKCRNFIPGTGRYLKSVSGFTTSDTSGPWSATQAASTILSFQTGWNNYTLTINPNGGKYNNSTGNTTVTQAFNTTYTLGYPTREGYLFSHWSASRGSNFDENGIHINVYNNKGNGTVTHTWMQSESTSGTNGDVLKIVTNGEASPGAGGFYQAYQTQASHTYYQIYRLKVPVGYTVSYANNAMGDSPVVTKFTDMAGTGDWKTYVFRLQTTSTGTFSTSGFIYLNGTNNTSVTWYVAQAQVWDVTDGVYRANSNGIFRYDFSASNCTLTANWVPINNMYVNVNGIWKGGLTFVNVNGTWKQAEAVYINVNGTWKQSTG